MFVIFIFFLIFLIYGIIEQINHYKRVKKVPIRIHVNGTRGKSTTTRLIAAGLREAGFKVLSKTTGTLPRLLLEDGTEIPIRRRGNANIIEQMKILAMATQRKADALVLECMAVNPELQWVSEHKMVKSTIGVITNVHEDHLEDIGLGLNNMAESLKLTIPQKGTLVTAEKNYLHTFQKQAGKINTKIISVDPNDISDEIIKKFNYLNFKENISIALQVNRLLGVKDEISLKGMIKAAPDPGALKIYELYKENKRVIFINAFAANDRTSNLLIWEKLKEKFDLDKIQIIGIVNNREDRALRAIQFAHILAEKIILSKIVLVGKLSTLAKKNLLKLKVPETRILNLGKMTDAKEVLQIIFSHFGQKAILIGFGNTRGMGQKLVEYFNQYGEIK